MRKFTSKDSHSSKNKLSWREGLWLWLGSLFGQWFSDIPSTVWSPSQLPPEEGLLQEAHTQPLATLLAWYNPELYQRWYHGVWSMTYAWRNAKQELKQLEEQKGEYERQIGALQAELEARLPLPEPPLSPHSVEDPLPEQPPGASFKLLLSVGLSLMLFLGLTEILGGNIKALYAVDSFSELIRQLIALSPSLVGAVMANLGEYWAVNALVLAVRKQDRIPEHGIVPFWHRLKQGDSAVWLSIIVVVLETAFASRGLLATLPPHLANDWFLKISLVAAGGLFALINLMLGWGESLNHLSWQKDCQQVQRANLERKRSMLSDEDYWARMKEHQLRVEELQRERQPLEKALGNARAGLNDCNQKIADKKEEVAQCFSRGQHEHIRWEHTVRKWLRENPEVIQELHKRDRGRIYPWPHDLDREEGT